MRPHDDDPQEPALEGLFAARERRDEAASPGFERILRRPAGRLRGRRWVPAAAGALLVALAVFGLVARRWQHLAPAPAPVPALADWKAPTDFLLAVPGGELLDSTPAFPSRNLPLPTDSVSRPRRL